MQVQYTEMLVKRKTLLQNQVFGPWDGRRKNRELRNNHSAVIGSRFV